MMGMPLTFILASLAICYCYNLNPKCPKGTRVENLTSCHNTVQKQESEKEPILYWFFIDLFYLFMFYVCVVYV